MRKWVAVLLLVVLFVGVLAMPSVALAHPKTVSWSKYQAMVNSRNDWKAKAKAFQLSRNNWKRDSALWEYEVAVFAHYNTYVEEALWVANDRLEVNGLEMVPQPNPALWWVEDEHGDFVSRIPNPEPPHLPPFDDLGVESVGVDPNVPWR